MKILNFFLISSLLIMSIACNDDDDDPCDAGNLAENIVGSWMISIDDSSGGDVEFKADGTLVDDDDIIVGFIGGSDHKHYVVTSNEDFTATAIKDSFMIEAEIYVTKNSCNEIILDNFGLEMKMTRK
jgi:hypothetical protein